MTERTYTERDLVLAKRTAYRHGAETWAGKTSSSYGDFVDAVHSSAARQYPLPTITRPRVVKAFGAEYRVLDGELQYRWTSEGQWQTTATMWPDSYRALVALLDNPNETVDA